MFLSCAIFFLSFGQNSADSAEVSSCFGVFCGRPTATNTVKRIVGKFSRSNSFITRPEFSTGWPFGILKGTSNSETLLKPGQICRAYFVYDDDNVNKFPLEVNLRYLLTRDIAIANAARTKPPSRIFLLPMWCFSDIAVVRYHLDFKFW